MCDHEAAVFLTQIVDGKMTQVNLCEKCSKDKGVTDPTGFQLADFLIGAGGAKKAKTSVVEDDSLACPECTFTRAHLKKIGRLGCPECYHTFSADLENMLRAMHKGTRHIGKVPGNAPPATLSTRRAPKVSAKKRLGEIKDSIERAVAEERYEDAARLRDEMRDIDPKKD